MAEGLFAGAVVSLIIEKVISCAKHALICTRVCKKLELELEQIHPDVRKIEQQMVHRRHLPAEPLEVVESWLARLKEKLTEAEREVHRCSSGKLASRLHLIENHDLSRKIQGLLSDIHRLAGDAVSRATLSSSIANGSNHNVCSSSPDTSQHGSSSHGSSHDGSFHHGYGDSPRADGSAISRVESQGSLLHRQRMDEIDSILRAEDLTRLSMNHRRHSIASFDFSSPAEQPVAHVHVESPVLHFQHHIAAQNFQQPGFHSSPQAGFSQQRVWFHSSFHGHNVHHG